MPSLSRLGLPTGKPFISFTNCGPHSYLGCSWRIIWDVLGTSTFSHSSLISSPSSLCHCEAEKERKRNLSRKITGLQKPLAERPKLTAACEPKPMFLLGMSWWSAEDVLEREVKKSTLQGAVCSFLSTIKEMNSKVVKTFKLVVYLDNSVPQTCLPHIRILMCWVPHVSIYSCSFGWWFSCCFTVKYTYIHIYIYMTLLCTCI